MNAAAVQKEIGEWVAAAKSGGKPAHSKQGKPNSTVKSDGATSRNDGREGAEVGRSTIYRAAARVADLELKTDYGKLIDHAAERFEGLAG